MSNHHCRSLLIAVLPDIFSTRLCSHLLHTFTFTLICHGDTPWRAQRQNLLHTSEPVTLNVLANSHVGLRRGNTPLTLPPARSHACCEHFRHISLARVPTGTEPSYRTCCSLTACAPYCVLLCELRRASKIGWGCLLLPNGPAPPGVVPAAGPAPGGVRLP